jgi:AI-2 transport protein TqsA
MAEETQSPATVARNALLVVAVILAGAALLWGASILTPLVLALFLLVMVDGC